MRADRYNNLDYLRLALAISVPVLHGWNATGPAMKGIFFAVPAFLALSGFVVLQSYETSKGAGHFFWKRLLRVGPAFIASLLLVWVLFGWSTVLPTLANWYTFGQTYTGRNNVLWSLSCEEVFYISLALLYAAGAYKKSVWIWMLFAASFLGTTLLLPHIYQRQYAHQIPLIFLPSAFFAGNLVYLYRDKLKALGPVVPTLLFALAIVALPFISIRPIPQYWNQTVFVVTAVWFGMAGFQSPYRLPVDISYGVYLYHMIVMGAIMRSGVHERERLILETIPITIVVALISAYSIERPALRLKDRVPSLNWRRKAEEPLKAPV